MRPPDSPTAGNSAWEPKSASARKSSTHAGLWALTHLRVINGLCAGRVRYGNKGLFERIGMYPVRDEKSWYTYVLLSLKDSETYTGSTNDLRKRFKQHSDGLSRSTKGRRPLKLIYYEMCMNEQDARSRELFLKSGMGKRYIKNRLKRFLSLTG